MRRLLAVLATCGVLIFNPSEIAIAQPAEFAELAWGSQREDVIQHLEQKGYQYDASESSDDYVHFRGELLNTSVMIGVGLPAEMGAGDVSVMTRQRGRATEAFFSTAIEILIDKYGAPEEWAEPNDIGDPHYYFAWDDSNVTLMYAPTVSVLIFYKSDEYRRLHQETDNADRDQF